MDDSSEARGPLSIPSTYAPHPHRRIMIVSVVVLFVAVFIIAIFHMYTRWFLARHRHNNSRVRRRTAHHDYNANAAASSILTDVKILEQRGVGPEILKALPTFLYSSSACNTAPDSLLECPVCISEFEEGETGRVLPNCKHSFHLGCIDMWFRTHSNCPLCRAPVQNPDGTLYILVQLQPAELIHDNDTRSSIIHDQKLPELTSVIVESAAEPEASVAGVPPQRIEAPLSPS